MNDKIISIPFLLAYGTSPVWFSLHTTIETEPLANHLEELRPILPVLSFELLDDELYLNLLHLRESHSYFSFRGFQRRGFT